MLDKGYSGNADRASNVPARGAHSENNLSLVVHRSGERPSTPLPVESYSQRVWGESRNDQ